MPQLKNKKVLKKARLRSEPNGQLQLDSCLTHVTLRVISVRKLPQAEPRCYQTSSLTETPKYYNRVLSRPFPEPDESNSHTHPVLTGL